MIKVKGYAADGAGDLLKPYTFERYEPDSHEVHIDVLFCGICHSDIHCVRNEWQSSLYPIVPGHEMVGKVVQVGDKVTQFKEGDIVGVGPIIGCCGKCDSCKDKLEQYCAEKFIEIFNSIDKHEMITRGAYSTKVVVNQEYVFHIPEELSSGDLACVAPLFCAGLTIYSPLRHWNINKNSTIGIVGIGGLGHLAIKVAKALGAQVVAFTSTTWKKEDAKRLGADEVVLSFDNEAFQKHLNSLDFILDTVPFAHDLNNYLKLLKRDGTLCLIGIPAIGHPPFDINKLVFSRRHITSSTLGSPDEMREFLQFCAKHNIVADCKVIKPEEINNSFERVLQRDIKYRFVIDMSSLK